MDKNSLTTASIEPQLNLELLGITFSPNSDNELWAEFTPLATSQDITVENFYRLVQIAGYTADNFPLAPANVSVFLDAVRRRQPQTTCISIPVDARVDVFISPNRLLAGVVVHGAQGKGNRLDFSTLEQAFKKAKITNGLIQEALDELTSSEVDALTRNNTNTYCSLVAYGTDFQNGQDARIEVLVADASDRRPIEDEFGRMHYLEMGHFPFVEEGTALLRRYPPTKGVAGVNVNGKTLRAKDGKDLQFRLKDATVKPADTDPDLILAAQSGMPVLYDRGVQIEETLKIDNVDLSTGHVRYRGSVEIKGDVRDGMQLLATGDIKIHGGVDAAFIQAGGHIEVAGGAIGNKKNNSLSAKAALKAGCSIKLRFAHEATLEAGHEILVGSQVTHSNLKSGSFIKVEGKGQVLGGKMQAVDYIEVNTTGAVAYIETEFEIGECASLQEEYTRLLAGLRVIDDKKYRLIELARQARKKGKAEVERIKDKLLAAKEKIQTEARNLNTQLAGYEEALRRFYAAKLIVNRRAYPGTLVHLANSKYEVKRELDKVTFYLEDGQVQTRQ